MKFLIIIFFFLTSVCSFGQTYTLDASLHNTTVTTCSGTFVDDGGSGGSCSANNALGNYSHSQDRVVTFCPSTPGEVIRLDFTTMCIKTAGSGRNCQDVLYTYQGDAAYYAANSATPDDAYCGEPVNPAPVIIANNASGCITVRFVSTNSQNLTGWVANISCVTPCVNPLAQLVDQNEAILCSSSSINPSTTVNFDGSLSTVGGYVSASHSLVQYVWDFGDGTSSITAGSTTSHDYTTPGVYLVKLSVGDDNYDMTSDGCISTNSMTRVVKVVPPPQITDLDASTTCGNCVDIEATALSQTAAETLPVVNVTQTSLPDGNGTCYESVADYSGLFPPGATISSGCYPTVCFNIDHSYTGDLIIYLIAPSGEQIRLFNRHNTDNNFGDCTPPAEDGVAGCGRNYCVVPSGGTAWTSGLTDAGADCGTCDASMETGGYYVAGNYASTDPFSNLDGAEMNGSWTFRVCDMQSLDDGTLHDWSITFPTSCYRTLNEITPDMDTIVWTPLSGAPAVNSTSSSSTTVFAPGPDPCPPAETCEGNELTSTANVCFGLGVVGAFDYQYTITDEYGCQYQGLAIIDVTCLCNATADISLSGLSPICAGESSELTINVTGTGPTFDVIYTDGTTNFTLDNIAAGITTINVSPTTTTTYTLVSVFDDGDACYGVISGSATVTVNPIPTVNDPADDVLCANTATAAVTFTGNNGSTTYNWTNDNTTTGLAASGTGDIASFTGLNAGATPNVSTVTVTPTLNGCVGTSQIFTITVNPIPVISLTPTDPSVCNGTDGFISVNGTGTGEVVWSGPMSGSQPAAVLNYDITGLGAGTYDVYFIDGTTLCQSATVQASLNNPGAPVLDIINDVTNCGTDYTLPAITGTSLNSPEYYTLSGGPLGGGVIVPVGTIYSAPTNITLYAYDENGPCTDEEPFTIIIHTLPTVTAVNGGDVYCTGDTPLPITVDVTGSSSWTINYTLDGAPLTANGATSPISLGNAAGEYVVTGITDANCSNTASGTETISFIALPTVTAVNGGDSYCPSEIPVNITVDVTGTANWTVDYTLDGTPFSANGSTSPISLGNAVGVYVVTNITDANCTNTATGSQTISIDPIPVITLTPTDPTVCNGTDGIVTVNGAGTGEVVWSGPASGSQPAATLNYNITGLEAGTYDVYFIDGTTTCQSATVQTTLNNPIPTVVDPADDDLCANTISTAVTFTGNNASITYDWTNDNTTTGLAASGTGDIASFTGLNTGATPNISTVTVTPTLNGCVGTPQVFTITVNPIPTVVDPADDDLCANTATAAVTFTGNNGSTTYNWTNDNATTGLAASGTGDITSFTGLNAGATPNISTVTVTPTLNGCVGTPQMFTITVNPIPTVVDPSDDVLCVNTATAAVTFTGNSGLTTYNWTNDNATTGLAASGTGNIASFTGLNVGATPNVSTVTVTPTLNGCVGTPQVFTITVNLIPAAPTAGTDTTYCFNWDVVAMTASGSGGIITWYSDVNLTNVTSSTPSSNLGTTLYYVTETANGCESPPDTVMITIENCDIIIPTALTPDGDGVNDVWEIIDLDAVYADNVVMVFNRWGNKLYESEKGAYASRPWDGKFEGEPLPVGSYYFIIDFNEEGVDPRKGVVSIIFNK